VVPCYREAEALAVLAHHMDEIQAEEIVCVDDGSDDGTAAALAELAAADARVRVETHTVNRGVGAAMRTGIAATTADVVVVYDADRTYPLQDAQHLVEALQDGVDVVTATPFGEGGGLEGVPAGRSLLSRTAVLAYRLVLGRRAKGISVFTCAFRAWRGPFVRGLLWRSDGFPAAAEMLGRALLAGARVVEHPSRLRRRTEGESKMRVLPAALGHLGTLCRLLGARLFGRGQAEESA
jgi:dolichol-phosphate mannosyltransferase